MKKILIIICITIILCTLISSVYFGTFNFIKSGIGVIRVVFTDTEIIKIKESPEIYLAKADNSPYDLLLNFMESQGYVESESERQVSTIVFKKNDEVKLVSFSVNKYFSKWEFE